MTPGPGLDRRRFLALLGAAAAGVSVASCADDGDDEGDGARVPDTIPPPAPSTLTEALVTLAAAVRRAAPDLEALDLRVDPDDPAAVAAAVEEIDDAAGRDLAEGSVIEVAGWILSTTEARLCLAVA